MVTVVIQEIMVVIIETQVVETNVITVVDWIIFLTVVGRSLENQNRLKQQWSTLLVAIPVLEL